jgi:L-ribulokinase
LPVDGAGRPLAFQKRFANNPAAMAWLWKDHTGVAEAAEITALARESRPHYWPSVVGFTPANGSSARSCIAGGLRPVFEAARSWVECADWIPAMLTGDGSAGPDQNWDLCSRS